jgi:hypothetical protein
MGSHLRVVERLLFAGADADQPDEAGMMPIECALESNATMVVHVLEQAALVGCSFASEPTASGLGVPQWFAGGCHSMHTAISRAGFENVCVMCLGFESNASLVASPRCDAAP